MKVIMFSARSYDREFFELAKKNFDHEILFVEERLLKKTAGLAKGYLAVCAFVHDELNKDVLEKLAKNGTSLIALRCAGFNNVDLKAAQKLGMTVARVPAYSPHGVAEHAIGLMLALNRKIHRAHARVREGNFLLDGLLGFDMYGKTVGVIGTGKIGEVVSRILYGFGCNILGYDIVPNPKCQALGMKYVDLNFLYANSDIITLHCPLMPQTKHLINSKSISKMKHGVMLINTSRGKIMDSKALIQGLKSEKIGYLGLDVYEEEGDLFFEDLSNAIIQDDLFARLLTFPNVIITGHQAFFTKEAMIGIAWTTLENITKFEQGSLSEKNLVTPALIKPI
jgi:D-lactate dehydrogenase